MAKRIKEYLAYVDKLLARDDVDFDEEMRRHLVQIEFFMHERLIHLLVTILFAILTVGCCVTFVVTEKIQILLLASALFVLLIPYIRHYYLLENSVQKMYTRRPGLEILLSPVMIFFGCCMIVFGIVEIIRSKAIRKREQQRKDHEMDVYLKMAEEMGVVVNPITHEIVKKEDDKS